MIDTMSFLIVLLLFIISFSSSFQLKKGCYNDVYQRCSTLSMQLKDIEILDLLKTTDRGLKATKEDIASINEWIQSRENQYNKKAIDDDKLYGYYDVSFVGTGNNQTGNPAGGEYRSKLGQLIYQNEGLYQHVLRTPDKGMGREISVINVVKGRLLHWFVLYVILDGYAKPLLSEEKLRLSNKFGNKLSEGTIKAFFLPPLLGLGLYHNNNKYLTFRVGPKSDVVLDTIYLDETFRLGRGSRGSTFIFKRLGEFDQQIFSYKKVLETKVVSGKLLGGVLTMLGFSLIKVGCKNLLRGFRFSLDRLFVSFLKISITFPGILIFLAGAFLLFSKGGIVEENFGN